MRKFESGATRDDNEGKPDYARFLSPQVIKRYGEFMLKHGVQADGKRRDPDNWKKGIPLQEYMSSEWRHHFDLWDGFVESGTVDQEAACALLFNVMGMLHEALKEDKYVPAA